MDDWEQIESNFEEFWHHLIERWKILDKSLVGIEHTEEDE